MKDREIIAGALGSIGRRLWVGRALREAFFGLSVLLFFLVAFQIAGAVQPAGIPTAGIPAGLAAVVAVIACAAFVAWRSSRSVTLEQAAAHADQRAVLHDELRSALWFSEQAERSPFIDAQLARATATAGNLDARVLVPARAPRSAFAAAGLALLLFLVLWLAPRLSPSWDAGAAPIPALAQQEDLKALLEDMPRDAGVEKLEQALDVLQRTDATEAQKKQAVADMNEVAGQAGLEAAAAREGVAQLAQIMEASPQLEKVGELLEAGRNQEALALLEKMRDDAANEPGAERFPEAKSGQQHQGSLAEQLDQAGRDLCGTPNLQSSVLDKVLKTLTEASDQIEKQNRITEVQRKARENMSVTNQRSAVPANEYGSSRLDVANPEPSPDNGNTDMQGGSTFRRDSANREEDADGTREGSRTGSASGESPSMALEGRATERLDAQLKKEALQRHEDDDGKDDDKNWVYAASQQKASELGLQDVRARAAFDRESAAPHDSIPLRRKQAVKDYFLDLHESEKK
jgi:hypothetical protein